MADIAFLLIIFFMVTTVHEVDRTSVNLPLAKTREEAEKGAAIVVLAKATDARGDENIIYKFSDGKAMSKVVTSVMIKVREFLFRRSINALPDCRMWRYESRQRDRLNGLCLRK